MSKLLKSLVEQYAPKTVLLSLAEIEKLQEGERELRAKRTGLVLSLMPVPKWQLEGRAPTLLEVTQARITARETAPVMES